MFRFPITNDGLLLRLGSDHDIDVKLQLTDRYTEPGQHLDYVKDMLLQSLPKESTKNLYVGFSLKDKTLIDSLQELPGEHLSLYLSDTYLVSDTSDAYLSQLPSVIERYCNDGYRLVLVVRHLLEHLRDPGFFLESLSLCVQDLLDAVVLIEVPDAVRQLTQMDSGVIWSKHLSYFSLDSLRGIIQSKACLPIMRMQSITTEKEPVILCLCSNANPAGESSLYPYIMSSSPIDNDSILHEYRSFYRHYLARLRDICLSSSSVLLYGAGHNGLTALGLGGLFPKLSHIVDDDPALHGKKVCYHSHCISISPPSKDLSLLVAWERTVVLMSIPTAYHSQAIGRLISFSQSPPTIVSMEEIARISLREYRQYMPA
jgi:hypothetical protein